MKWTPLNFGKHRGKTLPQVLFCDPDWFFWAWETGVFEGRRTYYPQAATICTRATAIRIPQLGPEPLVVEYNFSGGRSVGFDLVPASRPSHRGSTLTTRSDLIDLSVPYQAADYDKLAYRIFLHSLKFALFSDRSARMTRERCESFFDEERNFQRNT